MAFTEFETSTANISGLSDRPNQNDGLSSAQLKGRFDKAGNDIKTYINDVLLEELERTTDGDSGADNIGATAVGDGTATTVQGVLEELADVLVDIDTATVKNTGNESIAGVKNFTDSIYVSSFTIRDNGNTGEIIGGTAEDKLTFLQGDLKFNDDLVWTAGNDGPGSTLDADTLDGKQDADMVHKAGTETITGVKTFSVSPVVPTPTADGNPATKKYADDIASARYTKTNMQTSGQALLHWGNLTNVPNLADAHWKTPVATKSALPVTGNALGDNRVVLDDGDGKQAVYTCVATTGTYTQQWSKIGDVDWMTEEATRQTQETARVNAEGTESPKSGRVGAEIDRVAAENARVLAEGTADPRTGRIGAELDRVDAEEAREIAEGLRQAHINDKDNPHEVTAAQAGALSTTDAGDLAELTTTEKGSLVGAINELNTDKVETSAIVNTLTETEEGKVLDARQGKVLADLVSTNAAKSDIALATANANRNTLKFTATNLLDNGDFASESGGVATGWTKGSAITGVSVLNNTQFFTGAGALSASANNRFSQSGKIIEAGHWYYIRISAKKVSGSGDTMYMGTGDVSRLELILDGDFKDYSIVFQAGQSDPTSFALGAQAGLAVAVKYAFACDLTEIFGNEHIPDSAEMDKMLSLHENSWFDGEKQLMGLKDVYVVATQERAKIYGAKFVGSNSTGERTHDASGMIAECGVDDTLVRNDFDSVDFYQRPRCNIYHAADGTPIVMAYEGEPGFNLEGAVFPPYADLASVFYECKPCAWNGSFDSPQVTGTPMEGFELFECFPDWNTKIYLPSYWMATVDGKAVSISGTMPGYYSVNTAMSTARAYHANGHAETIETHMYEYILQIIEFATRDVQLKMMGASSMSHNSSSTTITTVISDTEFEVSKATGNAFVIGQSVSIGSARNGEQRTARVVIDNIVVGETASTITLEESVANLTVGDFLSTRVWRNGATDIVKASSGSPVSNTDAKHPCIWRGKVDPWANAYSVICNILLERTGDGSAEDPYVYTPYYLPDPTKYNAGAITSDYIKLRMELPGVDGYAKNLQVDKRFRLLGFPTLLGASNATFLAAYFYYGRYAVNGLFVGGHWRSDRRCSPVFFYFYDPPSVSYSFRLGRLCVSRS